MRFRRYAPIAVLMAFSVWLVAFTGCFGTGELFAYDRCVKWLPSHPQATNPHVIVVLVHDSDINRWRQADKNRTSIPDDELVNVIDHLESMGARAIGIDLYRDDPTFPKNHGAPATQDSRLPLETAFYDQAHGNWNNVVFGWAVKADENPGLPAFLPPNFILNDMGRFARQIGYVEVAPSSDSVIRTWCLFMTSSGQDSRISKKIPTITSLDFQLAWIALHGQQSSPAIRFDRSNEKLLLGGVEWPKVDEDLRPTSDKKRPYQIPADFSSFGGSAQQQLIRLSLDQVVQDRQEARQNVSDSIVLIGRDSSDVSDGPFKTPLGMERRLSGNVDDGEDGVVLHARCVDQLVLASQRKLHPLNTLNGFLRLAWDMFWSLLLAVVFAATPMKPWQRVAAVGFIIAVLCGVYWYSLSHYFLVPVAEPLITIIGTTIGFVSRITASARPAAQQLQPTNNKNLDLTSALANEPQNDRSTLKRPGDAGSAEVHRETVPAPNPAEGVSVQGKNSPGEPSNERGEFDEQLEVSEKRVEVAQGSDGGLSLGGADQLHGFPALKAETFIDYIQLDQAAALINRSKKTLERALADRAMPSPDVEGGGGKPHEWEYQKLKPWLEATYGKRLPDRPPRAAAKRS